MAMPTTVPMMMYLSNEIGAVPVLGAANAAFEHR